MNGTDFTFNRTKLELKHKKDEIYVAGEEPFNRTKLELKHNLINNFETIISIF